MLNNRVRYIYVLWVFVLWTSCGLAASGQVYRNLGLPTSYVFSKPKEEVIAVLKSIQGPSTWGPMAGAFFNDRDVYGFGVFDFYTDRYWRGRREKANEVSPPEAGRIGTIQANFVAHIESRGRDKTYVRVEVEEFEQQIARRYRLLSHFAKVPVFAKVRSDSYFEYLFLFTLGKRLGEFEMPAPPDAD
jgi:hypothetical protein